VRDQSSKCLISQHSKAAPAAVLTVAAAAAELLDKYENKVISKYAHVLAYKCNVEYKFPAYVRT